MIQPDSGKRCCDLADKGHRAGCPGKPDSGEREVPKLRRVPDWLLRQMVRDFRFAATEHGFDCGPYMEPGQHANWCGTFGATNCPMCAPLVNWDTQIPEAPVSLPLSLAQRILAALEECGEVVGPGMIFPRHTALADELRARLPK